jgi:hypothetical protein
MTRQTRFPSAKLLALLVFGSLAVRPACAEVLYQFSFSNLAGLVTYSDFTLTLAYDDFVTTTGLVPLSGPALPTSLGFSVIAAGTNNSGDWGFDGLGTAVLTDGGGFAFNAASMVWDPDSSSWPGGYITSPGTYSGTVFGNGVPSGFRGRATLTVSEVVTPVPEAETWAMWALGIGALALASRGRARSNKTLG